MKENANTALYDKAIDRAAMTRLYDRHLEGQVTVILDGHEVRLDELIRKRHISMPQIDDEIRRTFRSVNRTTRASLLDLAKNEVSFAYQNLEAVASRLLPPKRVPHRVTAEFILERPLYSDRTLEMGWSGIAVHERKRLEKIIREGIAEGKTHEQIALEVRKGNVHRITRQQSRSLVTTAVTSVTAQSDQSVYRMNRHLLRGWQYVAVLDDRTTWTCAHRDGEIFDVDNVEMLPPAHYNCRSTTIPVLKSWDDLLKSETLTALQRRKIEELPPDLLKYYDGEAPDKESYHSWLARQPQSVQLRHLGDYEKVKLFQSGKIHLNKFTDDGREIGLNELKATSDSGYNIPGTTRRFAEAKERLDAMQLPILTPDDLINDKELRKTLREYFILQSTGLDGTLSLTNYRGLRIHTKSAMKRRILTSPPTEAQLIYNPITGRYMDARLYQPTPGVLNDAKRRVREATDLLDRDKEFILDFVDSLDEHLGMNERAVITENLRHIFRRQRENGEYWGNFKAVVQSQIKYDVVNISDAIETQLRYDSDVYKKLLQGSFIDPVLGNTMLRKLHDEFVPSIIARNKWEDSVAPKIARQLRDFYDADLLLKHPVLWNNISERELDKFYMKFVHRLASADMPDRDQLAVSLGRDLYNAAGLNGTKKKWFELGLSLLEKNNDLFEIETFGVQKRRMRGKITGAYFGPYYDTLTYNLRLMDPRLQEYLKLTRKVETGMRVPSISDSNILLVRPNYKTYFVRHRGGWYDTRIPITSDFKDFPVEFVDREMADALNWAARARYRINDDFHEAMRKLLYFEDDRGKAKHYNERNEFRKYLAARGDTYERFKTMEWLSQEKLAFSNNVFIDHRARIYERGFIGPQAGETFRPFLDSAKVKALGVTGFDNFVDQMGAFLGGLSDKFEGRFDSLTFEGRRKIANKWRPEMVKIGNHLRRGKPADIRAILDSEIVALVDGEELAKFYRFAMESAKIDEYLRVETKKPSMSPYSKANLQSLDRYMTSLVMEQDASSSGAQIIALTTRNKQLAELSNVVPTFRKQRLYDEIAALTFEDPRFREINVRLGLTEKDLRKAAKGKVMVQFYGAGERTGILSIEGKLAKLLEKDSETLVIKASQRDAIVSEISARIARVERYDPDGARELRDLRDTVKEVLNKGQDIGEQMMEDLWFLDSKTRDFLEKASSSYNRVVTPNDFKAIGKIMSEYMEEEVPILKSFTRHLGKMAEAYLLHAKPSQSDFDWVEIAKGMIHKGNKGYVLPNRVSEILGLRANEPVREKILKRFLFWQPGSNLRDFVFGVPGPHPTKSGLRADSTPYNRRTGAKYFKLDIPYLTLGVTRQGLRPKLTIAKEKSFGVKLFRANKMPKSWTRIPWVNFDGKTLEQSFTQSFEERLAYKDADGNWVTNIIQVPQKSQNSWWDEVLNKKGKISDIADVTKAKTAYGVNANHSNDAVIVKRFHLWGKKNNVMTSTVHDAFFTHISDMFDARAVLRKIYADTLRSSPIKATLDEMRKRGLPRDVYEQLLNEAIELGLIPVIGRSRIGGRLMTDTDILLREDVLREIPRSFDTKFGWYGVG
jgi:SPP1 gp7 family putative phage head morphogenesis protein